MMANAIDHNIIIKERNVIPPGNGLRSGVDLADVVMFGTTCFDIWRQEGSGKIITLCKELDNYLAGGIGLRMITEFSGGPGSGKTQMCLQLCVNVQFPVELGGIGGKAIYIDTNQGFNPFRLKEIAQSAEENFRQTLKRKPSAAIVQFDANTILNNISYVYCANYKELLASIINLKRFSQEEPMLKLVVIDSFSFPLRSMDDYFSRTSIIYEMLTVLHELSMERGIAVVLTNELTTRIIGGTSKVSPALGDSYAHKINQRIILSFNAETGRHVALIDKSVISPRVSVPFLIKRNGIQGVS